MIKFVKVLPGGLNITHTDQDSDGLRFQCKPYLSFIYVKISGREKEIDAWISRVRGIEIDKSVYLSDMRDSSMTDLNNLKTECQSWITDIDAKLAVI